MTDSHEAPAKRLDSWKAISDYLGRDERTVRRWEKELGLPVRRVPGGRGHSVFAYVSEVETWLQTNPPVQTSPPRDGAVAAPLPVTPTSAPSSGWRRTQVLAAAAGVLALSVIAWRSLASERPAESMRFAMTTTSIVATAEAGDEVWRYTFP